MGQINRTTLAKLVAEGNAGTFLAEVGAKLGKASTPLAMFETAARTSWEASVSLFNESVETRRKAAVMPQGPERDKVELRAKELAQAGKLQLDEAIRIAALAAPYKHAKLAHVDQKLEGGLTVTVRDFKA